MKKKVTKAIFPVAGLGTRFLPATKSIPKEIMTLVDKPLIQYAIDEARAAGIQEFIFVTSRGKGALEDYFDSAPQLEMALRRQKKKELLKILKKSTMDSGEIAYIRQRDARGLGHAVWCARRLISNEPFAVILPDDVIASGTPCLKQMIDAYEEVSGSNMVATMAVPWDKVSSYGVIDAPNNERRLMRVDAMVEKPIRENAPSNLAIIGRYILTPQIFSHLRARKRGAGGEIQLTDAIANCLSDNGVYGYRFEGTRFDCGSKGGFLQATVAFGLERDDLRGELQEFLNNLQLTRDAAE